MLGLMLAGLLPHDRTSDNADRRALREKRENAGVLRLQLSTICDVACAACGLRPRPVAARPSALHYGSGGTRGSPPDRPTIEGSVSSSDVEGIRKSPNPGTPGDVKLSNCMSS